MTKPKRLNPTCTHWGNYLTESDDRHILAVHPYDADSEPTAIGQSLDAGRFHHAQSQIHRFLRLNGGYVASVNS